MALQPATAALQLYSLLIILIPLFSFAFLVYFLLKMIKFMQKKTEQQALLLEKIDRLIDLQESKQKD